MYDLIVIGGGAAGIMAAYFAAKNNKKVILLEKNEKLGKKIFITGKGRCNITNACDEQAFLNNIVKNPKFFISSYKSFSNADLIKLINSFGLKTKTERGERVFPISDKSADVISTLKKMLISVNAEIALNCYVKSIEKNGDIFSVITQAGEEYTGKNLLIATGGNTYSATGSNGEGYTFAKGFGHSVVDIHPALVPLEDAHRICPKMQGLTLKNIGFTLLQNNKKLYYEQGELLFTHFGISGPVVLSASCYINYLKELNLTAIIDFKPALTKEQLDARLLREIESNKNKQLSNLLGELLPSKAISVFMQEAKLKGDTKGNSLSKEIRGRIVEYLKNFEIKIADTRPLDEGIITSGGINTKEINPSTMESKLVKGLYFAGEVIDIFGKTGGFNLQIAFSTGAKVGENI